MAEKKILKGHMEFMKTSNALMMLLKKIDHKGYPAYKETKGVYQFEQYILDIEHVQAFQKICLIRNIKEWQYRITYCGSSEKSFQSYLLQRMVQERVV